jgi:hypothetical protein
VVAGGSSTLQIAGSAIFENGSSTTLNSDLLLNSPTTVVQVGADFAGAGSLVNTVGNSNLTNVNPNTIKGKPAGSAGSPTDLTPAQARAVLASDSGGGTTNFLRADATWAAPPGSGVGVVCRRWGTQAGFAIPTGSYATFISTPSANYVTGRLYRITFQFRALQAAALSSANFGIPAPANVNVPPASAGWLMQAQLILAPASPNYFGGMFSALFTVAVNGAYTFNCQASSGGGAMNLWNDLGGYAMLEDLGLDPGNG